MNENIIYIDPQKDSFYRVQLGQRPLIGQWYKKVKGFVINEEPGGGAASGIKSSRFALLFKSQAEAQSFIDEIKENKSLSISDIAWMSTKIYKSKVKWPAGDILVNIKDFIMTSGEKDAEKANFKTDVYISLAACDEILHIHYVEPEPAKDSFRDFRKYINSNVDIDKFIVFENDTSAKLLFEGVKNLGAGSLLLIHDKLENVTTLYVDSTHNSTDTLSQEFSIIVSELEKLENLTIDLSRANQSPSLQYNGSSNGLYNCPNLKSLTFKGNFSILGLHDDFISGCPNLSEVSFPKPIMKIDQRWRDPNIDDLSYGLGGIENTPAFSKLNVTYGSYLVDTIRKLLNKYNLTSVYIEEMKAGKIILQVPDDSVDNIDIKAIEQIADSSKLLIVINDYSKYLMKDISLCNVKIPHYRKDPIDVDFHTLLYTDDKATDINQSLDTFEKVMDAIISYTAITENDIDNYVFESRNKKSYKLNLEENDMKLNEEEIVEVENSNEISAISSISPRAKSKYLTIVANDPHEILSISAVNNAWDNFKKQTHLKTNAKIDKLELKRFINGGYGNWNRQYDTNVFLAFFDKPIPEKVFKDAENAPIKFEAGFFTIGTNHGKNYIKDYNPHMSYNCIYVMYMNSAENSQPKVIDADTQSAVDVLDMDNILDIE